MNLLMQASQGSGRAPQGSPPLPPLFLSSPSGCALALLLWAAATGASGQTTSGRCREELDSMLLDTNHQLLYSRSSRWCRVRLENQMAHCCAVSNFPQGTAEGCDASLCTADCRHNHMAVVCSQFGKACNVRRNPFTRSGPFASVRLSDGPMLEVLETFCVPNACNNGPDREALMQWYDVRYRAQRTGWQANYGQAALECGNDIMLIIFVTILVIVLCIGCVPVSLFVFVAPKEKGRTLVSQADMNADNPDVVQPMDAKVNQFSGAAQMLQ